MTIFNKLLQLKKCILNIEKHPVRLVAVSKTKSVLAIEEAISAGQLAFGENYVQEATEKVQILNKKYQKLEWHYLGKIQKNKIKTIAQYFDWVQTIDAEESARKLNDACEKLSKKMHICIQVNISNEYQKNGIHVDDIQSLSKYILENCPSLCLRGLMTIGLETDDKALLREMFNLMKRNYDSLKLDCSSVDTLSMGMSHDMVLAIEAGSTMVRIGSAIFGERTR